MRRLDDLPPALVLPPLTRIPVPPPPADVEHRGLPGTRVSRTTALGDFVEHGTRSWTSVPVPLTRGLVAVVCTVAGASGVLIGWLMTVLAGLAPCSGIACGVTTWAGVPVHLGLAALCVLAVVVTAIVGRGLRELHPAGIAALAVALLSGVVALSGVAALLGTAVIVAALCVHIVDRF